MKGALYLVPTPLDFGVDPAPLDMALPAHTLVQAAQLTHWITENAKSTRGFLKRVGESQPLAAPLQAQQIVELPREVHKKGDHGPGGFDAKPLLAPALTGHDVGLVSEAGMPAIADPGASVVRAAHELGLRVVPLVGPVSLMLALAASGLNGQHFAFVGYLPQDAAARSTRIRELEALALKTGQTQICIETPYRNEVLLKALQQGLHPHTRLAVMANASLPSVAVHSALVSQWKKSPPNLPLSAPAVFLFGR
ncbi:MAG: SAM-dependent methyltransferase [Hydrogenophaga sp.]|nr:SAM-dependent methyltransferase [Hydrogenophaga sp.]